MIRVSTEAQKLDDQHREMVRFCNDEGYDDLVFVEDKGASAIKLNDSYAMMISQVKESIESDPDIRCLAVWELSRAFRNEGVYYEIKEFLVKRKVQFLCKNPNLRLLNDDGSVNMGMEIAMSLFATMAKQEMEIKKERFRRAKDAMKEEGRYVGGQGVKFGYAVGVDGFYVVDEDEARIVREIFDMYATGHYSVRTLCDELDERGIRKKDGTPVSYHHIMRLVSDSSYIGFYNGRKYPQIISTELWEKVKKVREGHRLVIPKGRRYVFAAGLFKCSVCGRNMVAEGAQFRCWHHNRLSAPPHCENDLTIRVENLDGLLWWIASKEEIKSRMRSEEEMKIDYEGRIRVLREKVENLERKIAAMDEKKARIAELYIEGMITREEKEKRLNKGIIEVKAYKDTILSYNEKIEALVGQMEGNNESVGLERLKKVYEGVVSEDDLVMMNAVVKRQIRRVSSRSEWFGKDRDRRAVRQNAQMIEVELVSGEIRKYIYVARKYKGHYWFVYDESGREIPLLSVRKIVRESLGKGDPRAFKRM